jgi:hypothetical protein
MARDIYRYYFLNVFKLIMLRWETIASSQWDGM